MKTLNAFEDNYVVSRSGNLFNKHTIEPPKLNGNFYRLKRNNGKLIRIHQDRVNELINMSDSAIFHAKEAHKRELLSSHKQIAKWLNISVIAAELVIQP